MLLYLFLNSSTMVKVKSVPIKQADAPAPGKAVAKLSLEKKVGKKAISSKSMHKMIKELVKDCGRGGQTVGKQACDILHIVLEKHCTAILKGAQVRTLQHKRSTVTGEDVKKEARAVHAEMWPERFKK